MLEISNIQNDEPETWKSLADYSLQREYIHVIRDLPKHQNMIIIESNTQDHEPEIIC